MGINVAQRKALNEGFLDTVGEAGQAIEFSAVENVLEQLGELFMKNLGKYANKNLGKYANKKKGKYANKKKVVASGKLLSDSYFRIIEGDTLQILLPDYYDYPNKGVKGVKSSRNAPDSPYQFKNYGMNAEGRKSIKQYIASGKAKIKTVRKSRDKALGIGLEKKRLSVADAKANTLIYLIKRFGIKKTEYFTLSLEETFKDAEKYLSEALGYDIVASLKRLNNGGSN